MIYVYDASYVSALIIPDEKNPKIDKLHKAVKEDDDILTPQLLWYEIASVFRNLNRRKRYTFEQITHFFPLLAAIRLKTDFETGEMYSDKLWGLGNFYNLSSYDAAYLELADRKKATLCTLDKNLIEAAKTHGVTIIK
ncbi:MAG: type II toxin-antitoxin system VapC family toxin [Treponema sp.]|nr:type II toxin-antitoxin system VapC family toxin [Treponema sp.]